VQPRRDHGSLHPPAGGVAVRRAAAVGGDRQGGALGCQAGDHGRAHRRPRRRADCHGAVADPPSGRSGPRRDDRLPQHERRLRGGRPDRRPVPGPDRSRAAGRGARPPERGRPDDHGRVESDVLAIGTGTHGGLTVSKLEPPPADPNLPPEHLSDEAARKAELAVPAELVAESVGDYLRTSISRIKAGESGILPVVGGLFLISILFQSLNSNFLTAGNLVNLLVQAAVFSLLAMGEVFVLILGEIDLSVGYVAAIGGVIMADLASPAHGWPWWSAITAALLACAGIGLLQGSIITRIGLPSFVVTLAGLLFWQGVLLKILGNGGTIPIQDDTINNIASANISPLAGWILMLVLVAVFGLTLWRRDWKRRRAGLVAPPPAVTLLKIGGALLGGVALVLLCNHDRGIFAP